MQLPIPLQTALQTLVQSILQEGGQPILVGGAVRDCLMGRESKDLDVEVFGLQLDGLQTALTRIAPVQAVGRSFGVLKLNLGEFHIDVALPRRESKIGAGHRGFVVDSDPHMSFAEAAARRDFTINAMGFDLVGGQLLDPWGGQEDLRQGCLRHVSDAFDEDPLRVLRACQFAARFQFRIATATLQKCRALQDELPSLSRERVWEEIRKLLLKSEKPSIGLQALLSTGALSLFPPLIALQNVPQNPQYHPEGDVWVHTLLAVDAGAAIHRDADLDERETLIGLLAILAHDLGKPICTQLLDGVWRSPGHEAAGVEPARNLLECLGCPPSWHEEVLQLVREHTRPMRLWNQPVSDGSLRRLALRVPIPRLCRVALADARGSGNADHARSSACVDWLLQKAAQLDLLRQAPEPLLQGRDLLALGVTAGPSMGKILKQAFEAQLDGIFQDRDSGMAWLRENLLDQGE